VDVERLNTRNGNPALIKLIRAEIEKRGPVSFAWFMEQALYHLEHGYYSSGKCTIGRHGDYFTNVSVGPLFGRLLTAQFAEMWERLGETENFVIVEQGAHNGDFARDVLESAAKHRPDFFAALRYRIVEPFPILQDLQSQTLQSFRDKVEWRDSIEPFVGVHFSNELLDSMPVDLRGKLVGLDGNDFVFVQGAAIPEPPRKERPCNQATLDWLDSVSRNLLCGYFLIIDYGFSRDEFHGSIQVRAQHRHLDSPFERIGHADITMRVDWTSIAQRAQANGLQVAGFTDQYHFLTGIISGAGRSGSPAFAVLRRGRPETPADDWDQSSPPEIGKSPKMKRELQTLLHPEMLGRSFQALALAKNVDPGALRLAGFKFARASSALDL
jgi:SAM-dependent MidA family methyltransferase